MSHPLKYCSALAACLAAGAAAAQPMRMEAPPALYRQGEPMVLTPAPQASPNSPNEALVATFRQWSRRSGNPSFVVFWARSLTDDATSDFASYFAEVISATPWTLSDVQVSGRVAATDSRDQRIGQQMSEALQASFMNTLINSGGRVMDREALMRKVSLKQSVTERRDKQYLETLALEQGVEFLIEIVPDYKPSSPTDLTFLVKVTHLPTSTIRAQFASDGRPPAGRARFVAGAAGFERRTENRMTVQNVGAQIAYDTMGKFQ